nr:zinc finger, CCHC-type, retrotransposon Gag domain protein [Tanacetum cinerariifolium]
MPYTIARAISMHDYDMLPPSHRGGLVGVCLTPHHMELIPPPILLLKMVNTRIDADLSAAVQNALQTLLLHIRAEIREEFRTSSGPSDAGGNPPPNALQTLLPHIRAEIREEFRTSSGPSDAGGNPPPVTIHTWLERFNKQKPHSFEKATAPVDAENWMSHMEKIFDVMGCEDAFKTRFTVYKFEGNALAWWKAYKQAKGGDAWLVTVTWADFKKLFFLHFFPRAEQDRLKREYHSIRQTNTETSTEFMQHFLRLAGFFEVAAGTEEEQAKNFQWGLRRSTLNHLMCISYTDVAQVANAARNYEILHERDDEDTERPDKRRVVIDISRPLSRVVTGATVIITTVMDLTGEVVMTTTVVATTTTLAVTTGIWVMGVTRETGVISPTDLPILADFKKLFFLEFFPRAEQERLKREYHSIRQANTETSTEFMQRFLRLAGFLRAVAGTEEEQAKNFQWGLRRSTLNHLMCISYTDVAQVANAARNYEILYERDDDDTERPDKRQKSGDRPQPTSQQSSHRNHGHNNDRHGSDRIPVMGVTRETGVSSPTDLPILVPSSPGVPLRATPIQFALLVDADTRRVSSSC